jgi:hypothetical protein
MSVVVLFLDTKDLAVQLNCLLSIVFLKVESEIIDKHNLLLEKLFLLGVVEV